MAHRSTGGTAAAMYALGNTDFEYTCDYVSCDIVLCELRQRIDCRVLRVCDSRLTVPASNCTLCGYVLEYYSALSVSLSEPMSVILP